MQIYSNVANARKPKSWFCKGSGPDFSILRIDLAGSQASLEQGMEPPSNNL